MVNHLNIWIFICVILLNTMHIVIWLITIKYLDIHMINPFKRNVNSCMVLNKLITKPEYSTYYWLCYTDPTNQRIIHRKLKPLNFLYPYYLHHL